MAPTGNAAFIIEGKTIKSALEMNMERRGFSEIHESRLTQMAFNYSEVELMVIDEISMVGANIFCHMNRIWQKIKKQTA